MGDNDTRYQPESGRWTPGCNQKDPQDICERRQASRPPVVSPFPEEKQGWFRGARSNAEQQDKNESMKKCVVDIRYHAAVGDYSRILVVLTSHQGERTDGRNKKKWNEQGSILESD